MVWSSTVDPWSFDCPSHRAGHRLSGGADGLGDLHPSEFFGVSGSGVAMEGAVLNITRTGIETLQNWMFMVGFTTLYIYIHKHTQCFQIVWNHFAIFSGALIAFESNRLWERITA